MDSGVRVGEFDLANPRPLWGVRGCFSARVLIRNGVRPVGWIALPLDGRMDAISGERLLRAVEDQLRDAPAVPLDEPAEMPPITVVVCTRDRPIALRTCLESLRKLIYASYEVVVVDNASKGRETERLVRESSFRYMHEAYPGLDRARNCGAQAAKFAIVAYTDDDVRVDRYWLQGIARGFAFGDAACVTGLICPLELHAPAQVLFEQYGGMGKGFSAKSFDPAELTSAARLASHNVGVGANMAYLREALLKLGGFDPHLDVGTPSGGAGDLDMFHRLLSAGYTVRYEPSALVWHQHRRMLSGLHQQILNNGKSFGCYLIKAAHRRSVPIRGVLGFAARQWIGEWLLASSFSGRPGRNFSLVWREFWGMLQSPYAYLKTYRRLPWS